MIGGVYLAYPIDQAPQSASLVSFYQAIDLFKRYALDTNRVSWVFDPGDGFAVSRFAKKDDTLPAINRFALAQADLVVAFLPSGVASIGVPMEIDRAIALGKHVILFTDVNAWMLSWPGRGPVARYDDWQEDDLVAAVNVIANLEPVGDYRDPDPVLFTDLADGFAQVPTRAHEDDAGLDLYVSSTTVIQPGSFSDVPAGVGVALPAWATGIVTGRSSALRKRGLLVHTGVIDAGYRGPLFAGAWNMTNEPVTVEEGERIAQLLIFNNGTRHVQAMMVDGLPTSKRGERGFGSTGA